MFTELIIAYFLLKFNKYNKNFFVYAAYELIHHGFSKHNSRSERFRAAGIIYLQRPQSN